VEIEKIQILEKTETISLLGKRFFCTVETQLSSLPFIKPKIISNPSVEKEDHGV
jgi:hypothetical protein